MPSLSQESKDSLELEIENEDRAIAERESHRRGPKGPISKDPPSMLALERLQQIASRPSIAMDDSTLAIVNPMLLRSQRISQDRLLSRDATAVDRTLRGDGGRLEMDTDSKVAIALEGEEVELDEREGDSDEEDPSEIEPSQQRLPEIIIASQRAYTSPFTTVLESPTTAPRDPTVRFRYTRMAATDIALNDFLASIAETAPADVLSLVSSELARLDDRILF